MRTTMTDQQELNDQVRIIDVDTHLTEPPDLWTSRAPQDVKDRVPRVVATDGQPEWVIDNRSMGFASGYATVRSDGGKESLEGFFGLSVYDVIDAAWDPIKRVELMDAIGVYAQVIYPNMAGFGGERFARLQDESLKRICVSIYNDAMMEMQDASAARLVPMTLVPWWDIEGSVAEVRRCAGLDSRGIVMCTDPHLRGTADLGDSAWNPFWEACCELELPVNFHIGASSEGIESFSAGSSSWSSIGRAGNMIVAGPAMFLNNGRILMNLAMSGVFERFPELRVVSVESGVGWIPFLMEAIDHQHREEVVAGHRHLAKDPSEYIREQVYACFFFEHLRPELFDMVSEDRVMFETDFPHPTCLYPEFRELLERNVGDLSTERRRKVVQDNAAALYRLVV